MFCPQCGGEMPEDGRCPACSASAAESIPTAIVPPPPPMVPPTPVAMPGQAPVFAYGELEHAVTFQGMANTLRGIGIGQIVWGVISLLFSLSFLIEGFSFDFYSSVMLAIAISFCALFVMLIGVGIWLVAAPSAAGLLVAAITMFVCPILLISLSIFGLLIMVIVIAYGVTLLRLYRKYGPLMRQKPSAAMLAQAKQLLAPLSRGKLKRVPELIEFVTTNSTARRWWRGLLLGNMAVFVALDARMLGRAIAEVVVLGPGGVEIEITGKVLLSKMQKGVLYLNNLHFKGMLSPVSNARYVEWKQGCQPRLTPPPPVPLP